MTPGKTHERVFSSTSEASLFITTEIQRVSMNWVNRRYKVIVRVRNSSSYIYTPQQFRDLLRVAGALVTENVDKVTVQRTEEEK